MTVKSMLVRIGGDPSGLQTAFKKADGMIQKHSEKFKKAGRAMTVAGAAIVGSLGMMVKGYASAGDEIHKMALRTSFSTEALSELKYAAEISGASLADIEKGVKKMSKTIVDASDGMETYERAFDRIGLTAEELINLSPEEQFDKISQAIARVENPTIKAAAAQDILGRAGTKLLPLFAEGEEGLEALRSKAREMGRVFDQEAANKAAALTDSMTTLKGSLQGVGQNLAGTLAPAITSLTDKISAVAIKIKDWMKEHPELTAVILKVVGAVGILLTILGPILIMLPALSAGVTLLGAAFWSALGPIALVTAAAIGAYTVLKKLQKAQEEAAEAEERFQEVNTRLVNKLKEAADAAGLTRAEFHALSEKYDGNTAAMAMAIKKGKEGVALQESLAKVGKEHSLVIEEQKKAQEDALTAEIRVAQAREAAIKQAAFISQANKTFTDTIKQLTLSEYEYKKWALEQSYMDKAAAIEKEVEQGKARNVLLMELETAKNLELGELNKENREKELQDKIDFGVAIKEQEQQMDLDRIASFQVFKDKKQELTDAINLLTMSKLDTALLALKRERETEEKNIKDSTDLNREQKEELLAQVTDYYDQKDKLAKEDAANLTELETNTIAALTSLYGNFLTDTLSAFGEWGAGKEGILTGIAGAFKTMVSDAIGALKQLVVQEALAAAKSKLASMGTAIAGVIKSVMLSIPFPLNLIVVGGAIAAVTALFSRIKLGEGGVVMKPTPAIIGERGPEAVIPLNKLSSSGLAPGPISFKQTNYFYGDINNVGDLDEISKRLAERTRRSIERGRK